MTTTTDDALRAIRAELTIDRARAAARSGDLDEALRVLRELDAAGAAGTATLDLLARVHAQRGEFTEADACWSRVQNGTDRSGEPGGSSDAAAGRRVIAEITAGRRPALAPLRPARIALVGVPLAAALITGALIWPSRGSDTSAPDRASVASRLRQQTERADTLERRLRSAHDQQATAAARRTRILAEAERHLRMRGIRVHRSGDRLHVVFTTGLFAPDDVEPGPDGATLLERVARRLPRRDVAITVIGHTVAVPGGRTNGGSTVAVARALAAAQRLATAGHLPLTAFALATADQRNVLFRDDRRNRTVTLEITPLPPSTT